MLVKQVLILPLESAVLLRKQVPSAHQSPTCTRVYRYDGQLVVAYTGIMVNWSVSAVFVTFLFLFKVM